MNTLVTLLAMDDKAHRAGCGLNPALRRAIEAQTRFPSVAASPSISTKLDDDALPANVSRLRPQGSKPKRKSA